MKNPKPMFNDYLGHRAVMFWSEEDLAGASGWVIGNWQRLEKLGRASSYRWGMDSKRRRKQFQFKKKYEDKTVADSLGQAVVRRHFHVGGFEAVEEFVRNFDAETGVFILKPLFVSPGSLGEGEFYPVRLAEKLATFPHREPYGELKEVAWLRWFQHWGDILLDDEERMVGRRVTTAEYMRALPPHLAEDFKRSCLDELPKIEKGGSE